MAKNKLIVADPEGRVKRRIAISSSRNEARAFLKRKLGIANGVDATLGAFPQVVMIRVINTDNSEVRCAGVLFAYNVAVTAGKLTFLVISGDFLRLIWGQGVRI